MPRSDPDARPEPARLQLGAHLDLGGAAPLAGFLGEARGHDLVLEGRAVRHLGGAGLQALISAARTWQADGCRLTLEAPSEALVAGLARLGAGLEDVTCEEGVTA